MPCRCGDNQGAPIRELLINLEADDRVARCFVRRKDGRKAPQRSARSTFEIGDAASILRRLGADRVPDTDQSKSLWNLLFSDPTCRDLMVQSLQEAADGPLRVRIAVDDARLAAIPIELIQVPYEHARGAGAVMQRHDNVAVIRERPDTEEASLSGDTELQRPATVAIVAHDGGPAWISDPPDFAADLSPVVDVIKQSGNEPIVLDGDELTWSTIDNELRRHAESGPVDVVQLWCHGRADEPALLFAEGWVDTETIGATLRAIEAQFVVLRACDSAVPVASAPGGIAGRLVNEGMSCVVGMTGKVYEHTTVDLVVKLSRLVARPRPGPLDDLVRRALPARMSQGDAAHDGATRVTTHFATGFDGLLRSRGPSTTRTPPPALAVKESDTPTTTTTGLSTTIPPRSPSSVNSGPIARIGPAPLRTWSAFVADGEVWLSSASRAPARVAGLADDGVIEIPYRPDGSPFVVDPSGTRFAAVEGNCLRTGRLDERGRLCAWPTAAGSLLGPDECLLFVEACGWTMDVALAGPKGTRTLRMSKGGPAESVPTDLGLPSRAVRTRHGVATIGADGRLTWRGRTVIPHGAPSTGWVDLDGAYNGRHSVLVAAHDECVIALTVGEDEPQWRTVPIPARPNLEVCVARDRLGSLPPRIVVHDPTEHLLHIRAFDAHGGP